MSSLTLYENIFLGLIIGVPVSAAIVWAIWYSVNSLVDEERHARKKEAEQKFNRTAAYFIFAFFICLALFMGYTLLGGALHLLFDVEFPGVLDK